MSNSTTRRRLRVAGIALGALLGAGLIAAGLLASVLMHERGATRTAKHVLERVRPYPGASLQLERLDLGPSGDIELGRARLVEGDSVDVAGFDAARLHLSWTGLLHGRVEIDSLQIESPRVDLGRLMRGLATRSGAAPRRASEPHAPPKVAIHVADLVLRRGELEVPLHEQAGTAPLVVRHIDLHATELRVGPGFDVRLDSLAALLTHADLARPAVLRARGEVGGGRASIDSLRVETPTSRVTLRGTAPLGAGLLHALANLNLDLEALPLDATDLAPFVAVPPGGGRFETRLHVALRGDPQHTTGTTTLAAAGTWGAHRVPAAHLDATWTDGRADLDLDADLDGRTLGLVGSLRPFDPTVRYDLEARLPVGRVLLGGDVVPAAGPSWSIERGRLSGFDLSQLIASAPRTDLTLTLVARGRGLHPDSLTLDAEISVAPGRVGTVVVDSLWLRAGMRSGEATLDSRAGVCGTATSLEARARPFGPEPAIESATLRFAHLDLVRCVPGARPPTDLSGTLTLEAARLRSRDRNARARLVLAPSRIGEQAVRSGDLGLQLAGDDVTLKGAIRVEGGEIALDARTRPFEPSRPTVLREMRFSALDVGALLANPALRSRLTGRVTGEARGTTPAACRARATLDLAPSEMCGVDIDAVHAEAGYEAGAARLDLQLQAPGASGSLHAEGMLRGPEAGYRAQAALQSQDLSRLLRRELPPGEFAARLEAEGSGFDPRSLRARAALSGRGSVGSARFDSVSAGLHIRGDTLRIDSLAVRSNVLRLAGSGTVELPAGLPPPGDSLQLAGQLIDARPLALLLDRHKLELASGDFGAVLRGRPAGAAFDARLGARRVHVDSLQVAALEVVARGTLGPERHPRELDLRAAADSLRAGDFMLRRATATLGGDASEAQVQVAAAVDDSTRLRLVAHGTPRPSGRGTLDSLEVVVAPSRWALEHPVQVGYGRRLQVDDLRLVSGRRHILLNGVLDPAGEHAFSAQLDSIELGRVAAFLGRNDFSGTLEGAVRVVGPAAAPAVTGFLAVDLDQNGAPIGALQARFAHERGSLQLDARVVNPARDSLTVAGRLPLSLPGLPGAASRPDDSGAPSNSDDSSATSRSNGSSTPARPNEPGAPLDLALHADGFAIESLAGLFPPSVVRRLGGVLQLDARVTGTKSAPEIRGNVRLERGVVQIMALGATYTDLSLAAGLDGDAIRLQQLAAVSGNGSVQANGQLQLGTRAVDLRANLRRFRAVSNRKLRLAATGELAISGSLGAPTVKGSLTLADTDIDVSDLGSTSAQAVQLTPADLAMLEENFGYRPKAGRGAPSSLLEATTLGVVIEVGSNTWVRRRANPRAALEMSGSVDVRKQPQAPLQAFGRLEVLPRRSFAEQLGRRFEVETGVVVLNGDPQNSLLDLVAKWEIASTQSSEPQAVIRLAVKGTGENLQLKFTSDPAMDENQIVTSIATGRLPASAAGQEQTSGAPDAVTAIAIEQAAAVVENAGSSVGLDVVQLRNDDVRGTGAVLVAGNYVNSKTYLGVRQSATFQSQTNTSSSTGATTEVELEYALKRWLLANIQGGVSDIRLMFRSKYSY